MPQISKWNYFNKRKEPTRWSLKLLFASELSNGWGQMDEQLLEEKLDDFKLQFLLNL